MRCRPPVASYALRCRSATCTTRPVRSWDSDAEVQAAVRDLFAACKFQQCGPLYFGRFLRFLDR